MRYNLQSSSRPRMHNELLALLNMGPILANLGSYKSTCRHPGEYIDSKLETIASIFWRNFPLDVLIFAFLQDEKGR